MELEAIALTQFVPLILSAGASRVEMIRTAELSLSVVTEYADEATANAAQSKIAEIRAKAAEARCVDIFCRPDGRFGFEEYRREPEDVRGWFPIGNYSERMFETPLDALLHAKQVVSWLASVVKAD